MNIGVNENKNAHMVKVSGEKEDDNVWCEDASGNVRTQTRQRRAAVSRNAEHRSTTLRTRDQGFAR